MTDQAPADTVVVPEDLKLLLAHTLVEDLRAQHPDVEQIDNERGDLWLPGGTTPQSSGCAIDVHSLASALEAEMSGLIRDAYKSGWNDREGDLLVGADRVLGLAARPAATPGGEREDSAFRIASDLHAAYEQLIYGLPKYLEAENLTDEENMIREAYITLDVTAHRLAALSRPAPVAGEAEKALKTALGHMAWMRTYVPCVMDVTNERLDEIDDFLATPTPEPAAARGGEPDMFWDESDPEVGGADPRYVLDNYAPGEVVKLLTGFHGPVLWGVMNEEGQSQTFATAEEAEAWFAALSAKGGS